MLLLCDVPGANSHHKKTLWLLAIENMLLGKCVTNILLFLYLSSFLSLWEERLGLLEYRFCL